MRYEVDGNTPYADTPSWRYTLPLTRSYVQPVTLCVLYRVEVKENDTDDAPTGIHILSGSRVPSFVPPLFIKYMFAIFHRG